MHGGVKKLTTKMLHIRKLIVAVLILMEQEKFGSASLVAPISAVRIRANGANNASGSEKQKEDSAIYGTSGDGKKIVPRKNGTNSIPRCISGKSVACFGLLCSVTKYVPYGWAHILFAVCNAVFVHNRNGYGHAQVLEVGLDADPVCSEVEPMDRVLL